MFRYHGKCSILLQDWFAANPEMSSVIGATRQLAIACEVSSEAESTNFHTQFLERIPKQGVVMHERGIGAPIFTI